MALAERVIRGEFKGQKSDNVAFEFGTTGQSLRVAVCKMRKLMHDWEGKPPEPVLRYAFAARGKVETINDGPDWGKYPCVVIPCRTRKEARLLLSRYRKIHRKMKSK